MTIEAETPHVRAEAQQLGQTHREYAIPRQLLLDARPNSLTIHMGTDKNGTPNNRVDIAGNCYVLAEPSRFIVGVPVEDSLEEALGLDVVDGLTGRGPHSAMVAALQRRIDLSQQLV